MVPAPSVRVPRVPTYSGPRRPFRCFGYGSFTLSGRIFQNRSPTPSGPLGGSVPRRARTTVWAPPRSLAATCGIDLSFFSSGYLDVSVHRVPLRTLCSRFHLRMTEVFSAGFPHSDISGSLDICSSPELFAAYHVFLRLLVPRHPPCALIRLTFACIALHALAGSFQYPYCCFFFL